MKLRFVFFVATLLLVGCANSNDAIDPLQGQTPTERYVPEKFDYSLGSKVSPTGVECVNFQPGAEPQKMIDGDLNTGYHSNWGKKTEEHWPIHIDFFFKDVQQLSSLVYYPRPSGTNGLFQVVEIWATVQGSRGLEKVMDFDFGGNSHPTTLLFSKPLIHPTQIRLVVKSGVNNLAQCSEIAFYSADQQTYDPSMIFKDKACTVFREGVTLKDINQIPNPFFKNLALHLFKGTYDADCRIGTYKPFPHPSKFANQYKISTYSMRDNPTGIYVKENDDLVVMVDETYGQHISLLVQDLDKGFGGASYALKDGLNFFKVSQKGLVYVMYYTPDGNEPPVKIHIASGLKNGVYRLGKHSELQYKMMLSNAVSPYIDLIGDYAHLTYPVSDLISQRSPAEDLLTVYENIVRWEQEFLGLIKYHQRIPNHIYFMFDIEGKTPYATAFRTAFHKGSMGLMCNANKLKVGDGCWGAAHEAGHINQTRPSFRWVGMTEVSNNIMSLYVQKRLANVSRLQQNGVYERAFNDLRNKKVSHVLCKDVFSKLVPFWQLQLYYAEVKGEVDFYKDLYEAIRLNPVPKTNGDCQLNFMVTACKVAKEDLTDFFEAWGFFEPVNQVIKDYSEQEMVITPEMIERTRFEIRALNLPKPSQKIEDLTDATVQLYK